MKTTYIYVKRLPNGLLYLGKTESSNPYEYKGSGKKWRSEIKRGGYKLSDIETWILHKTDDKDELVKLCLYYSNLFNVKNSFLWANLKDEEGDGGNTVGGTYIVEKEGQRKHIKKEELDEYIKCGWIRSSHTKGLIVINKDNIEKRVNKSSINYYIQNGWKLGRIKKSIRKLQNTMWINNGIEEKRIQKDCAMEFDTTIWSFGRLYTVGNKVSSSQKGRKLSSDSIEKMKKAWTNERRIKQSEKVSGDNNPSKDPEVLKKQIDNRKKFFRENPHVLVEANKKICVKITQLNLQGEIIRDWDSIKSICEELNVTRNTFKYALNTGKVLLHSLWKYKDK